MYKKITFPNGIRLITVPSEHLETATVTALFGVGSRHEKPEEEGMAHFLEHMLFKGTARRPSATAISKELDSIGASYNAFTGKEYTGFWAETEKKDLTLALDIMGDIILNSRFDPEEIEKEKGAVIEEINMYEDAPMRDIPSVFENLLYRGQSLEHDQLGSKEGVRGFTREALTAFHDRYYRSDNLVLVVSGNFDPVRLRRQVAECFAPLKPSARPLTLKGARNRDQQEAPQAFVKYKKTDQTNFSLGLRTFPTGHKDNYVLDLLNIILGGTSSSRLYTRVREQEGLAYYIYTYAEDFRDVGYFTIQSGVGNDKCEHALRLVMEELRKLRNEEVDEEELRRAKGCIKGRMAIAFESASSLAIFIAAQELLTGEVLTPREKFARIKAVSGADIRRVARKIIVDEKLNLALIGPWRSEDKFEKIIRL